MGGMGGKESDESNKLLFTHSLIGKDYLPLE